LMKGEKDAFKKMLDRKFPPHQAIMAKAVAARNIAQKTDIPPLLVGRKSVPPSSVNSRGRNRFTTYEELQSDRFSRK
jgi:hypothetical protein